LRAMASLVSYGVCQTVCNAGAVACYAGAGLTFGTVTAGVGMPAAALVCNTSLGGCMSLCASKFLAEASVETTASGGVMGPVLAVGGAALASGSAFWAWQAGAFGASATTTVATAGTATSVGSAAGAFGVASATTAVATAGTATALGSAAGAVGAASATSAVATACTATAVGSAAGAVGVASATTAVATAGTATAVGSAAGAFGAASATTTVATAGAAAVLGPAALVVCLVAASAAGIWKWTCTGSNADPDVSSGADKKQVLEAFPKQLRVQIQISEDIAYDEDGGSSSHGGTGPIGKLDTELRQALVAEYMHHYGEFLGREGHVLRGDNGRIIVSFQDDNMWFGKLREVSLPHRVLMTVMDGDAEEQMAQFQPAEQFERTRTGDVFQLGVKGVGYYKDQMAQLQPEEEFEGTRKGYVFKLGEVAQFQHAEEFEGTRKGYVFKLGVRGLGYYKDTMKS